MFIFLLPNLAQIRPGRDLFILENVLEHSNMRRVDLLSVTSVNSESDQ